MRAGVVIFSSVLACAARQLPPGNDLEHPENDEEVEPNTVGNSNMPTSSRELAKAFEPPPEPKVQPSARPQAAAPVEPDLSAQERQDFLVRLSEAKKQVARSDFENAGPALDVLEHDANKVGPGELQDVLDLQTRVTLALKDYRGTRKAAEKWLEACGPDHVDACRGKAIGALNRVAQAHAPEAAGAKTRATAIKTADTCVIGAELGVRAKVPAPPCLGEALGTYKSLGDKLMVARATVVKAQGAQNEDKKERALELFEHAARTCDEPRCGSVRRRALKLAGWLALEDGDPHRAAKLMIEEMGVGAERLPQDKRRYARTPEVDRVCASLDARDGPGACRKLEKQVLGDYMFKDFSTQKAGSGLAADTVRTVNEHYNVSLQECLSAEAARLVPPAYETYQVQWMVGNDGRVDQVQMLRKDQEGTELASCLRRVFVVWRYPRYDGEAQHVSQSFTVSARARGR